MVLGTIYYGQFNLKVDNIVYYAVSVDFSALTFGWLELQICSQYRQTLSITLVPHGGKMSGLRVRLQMRSVLEEDS